MFTHAEAKQQQGPIPKWSTEKPRDGNECKHTVLSYPDCAVGSVDNEGGEREMCTAAFHYEILCITVIQRASCSLWRVPDSCVGNLRDSGVAQLISGHIWHGLHGCYRN
ncbi:hypothetical protein CHARACLAT_003441 [Characodon lateralis]|uniref:Uncharacterized protein n=1 Tax=Characodon lateralis TaxID=208331 RepID=A0ABU7E0L9_9TELE|nr:hypothetical protein [Characodon lateralis]